MTEVGDSNHEWKTYRDRVGYGNLLPGAADGIQNAPGWAGVCIEVVGFCDSDPRKNLNGGLGMDQIEPHTVRRRPRDCTGCHLGDNASGMSLVSAVYGWNPSGYTAETSAYLNTVSQVTTPHGDYSTEDGYVIDDDGIEHRLDHLVDEETGYPLVSNLHVRTDDGRDGRPGAGYETYDREIAGPVTLQLIERIKRIWVRDFYDDE